MSFLDGISLKSRVALLIAGIIMMTFFLVQTCVVFGICDNTYFLDVFGYICVVSFMPPFFFVVREFLFKKEEVAKELGKKNIYLEHAAKIIRHDMHSGINTYLPRGIKSLKRRLPEETINELNISSPIQLIEDGLRHAQKVYAGVYEFTNLVKQDVQMSKSPKDVKQILNEYLRLTAYKNQVLLDDNLPKDLNINEPLFCTAIDNLIRNGLKYNDSPTKWVKIYYEEDSLYIEDNGRGMSNEDFKRLSQPYVRREDQKENGTGLGLNICTEILKEHGFKISCDKTNQGTKIRIKTIY
jgi:signal transduction histidine kinase